MQRNSDSSDRLVGVARKSLRGFSLVELMVTLLIVAVLAAVASPRLAAGLNHYRVEAAAARVAADLNYVRRYAMNTSTSRPLTFVVKGNASSNHYKSAGSAAVPDPRHPTEKLSVTLGEVAPGAQLSSASFDGDRTVTFNEYGLPLTGNPLTLLVSGAVVVSAGSEQRTIVVDPATGKAVVQ